MKYKHKITGEEVKVYNENYYIATDTACIPKRFIENSKDWQKVEELDYEILSVISNDKIVISKSGYTYPECFQTLLDQKDDFDIHSVKRLLNGEVFTIGDEATVDLDKKRYVIMAIRKFTNAIQIHGQIDGKSFFYNLKDVIKLKPKNPLFTTEDGVDIFDGESYWVVAGGSIINFTSSWIRTDNVLRSAFSTKEKAEEYIILNKPCLSLNDVSKHYKALLSFSNGNSRGLREIVKSRL